MRGPVSPQPNVTEAPRLGSPASTVPLAILKSVTVQLSLEPLFTSAALTVAWPLAFRITVIALHLAVGSVLSTTVTVAVQVAALLLSSVTCSVTVLGPVLLQ